MFPHFNKALRAVATLAAATLLALAAPAANAYVVYNNLSSSRDGSDPLFSFGPLADSFKTGAAGYLSGVDLLLTNGSADIVGDIQVSLRANNGNVPGAELMSLGYLSSSNVATTDFNVYTFTPVAAYMLAANTTYWVELISKGANAIEWSWSNDLTGLGVAGQSNYSQALGTNANSVFGPYQMAVTVPEPGSLALVGLGLGLFAATRRRKSD